MIIGTGIDIVDISRIDTLVKKYGIRFTKRIFSTDELEYCMKRHDAATCLAGRFAVKEAVFKALSAGRSSGIPFKDISVDMSSGAPRISLAGKALETALSLGMVNSHASISHDMGCAVAVVILESI